MEKKFVIQVLTLQDTILVFKVQEYKLHEGMIHFTDLKTGMKKSFPTSKVTIDEVVEWNLFGVRFAPK